MAVEEWRVEWPTLGWLVSDWIEAHCIIPDGFRKGEPFTLLTWQLWCTANHYRMKPKAQIGQLATAFHYRRSLVVGPQKAGKGPWSASVVGAEAVGPVVFDGWAGRDDGFACADWGCGCGWEFAYEPGEPMGRPYPGPEIQLLATSEDQVANVYRPLQAMAREGALGERMRVGEEFIRLPDGGRVDPVTSSATGRLGNPIRFAMQDETGLYTRSNKMLSIAQTQRRNLAGMGGRSIQTTNAWDPTEASDAQQTFESRRPDVFKFYREPPKNLSYRNKRERRKIHAVAYEGCDHVDLDGIEGEAAELLETDPAQAERFFGNRLVKGAGSWLTDGLWASRETPIHVGVTHRIPVAAGFDGSDVDDWTAIRLETDGGWQFTPTYGPDDRPTIWNPAEWRGRIPRSEVHAAWDELFNHPRLRIVRAYCDRREWQTEVDVTWPALYGERVIIGWETYRIRQMHDALERFVTDLNTGALTHDDCPLAEQHVENARKLARPGDRYILGKPSQHQKIDVAMTSVLAHEAAADAAAADEFTTEPTYYSWSA